MQYPNFNEEKKLWSKGYKMVAGLDEAGRGPLAGPVVAAAVMISHGAKIFSLKSFREIRDSKKISRQQREFFYKKLTAHKHIQWKVGVVSEKVIDKINILEATKLAMLKAVKNLNTKPDFLILDGNFKIKSTIMQKPIIKADEKIFSCMAAGIIAKVSRDKIMQKIHKKYPDYGFDKHKGYGTALHIKNLKNLGPCIIHRKTFRPVSILSAAQ